MAPSGFQIAYVLACVWALMTFIRSSFSFLSSPTCHTTHNDLEK